MDQKSSWFLALVALLAGHAAAASRAAVPSAPATWNEDFQRLIEPTADCAGGAIELLAKRAVLSGPYSPLEIEAFHPGTLPMPGLLPSDRFHSFYARSELPGGRFWAFGGYAVVRGSCIIAAEVDTYDN